MKDLHSLIFSVGHGTRSAEALGALLEEAGVRRLVDVRTAPRSRRYPHFDRDALEAFLRGQGIAYTHLKGLGGWRRAAADSPHTALRVPGFRGYADHMGSPEFARDYAQLVAIAAQAPTAFLCAETHWWRCHRRLLADRLALDGWRVAHLIAAGERREHELPAYARVVGGRLLYDGLQGTIP